ncbi:MAG: CAP domain-containing protein [Cyclobacteriaceae bacterium]
MKSFIILTLLVVIQTSDTVQSITAIETAICLNPEEKKLYTMMMHYRKAKGLGPIRISAQLSQVAQAHARDLAENYKFDVKNKCNPHSWSSKGKWSSCCYTNDHKKAQCMWDKPREIAGYESAGYEIAYYSSAGASAAEGLEGWKKSPSHNPLIVNEGIWNKVDWKGVGVGVYKEYGVVWFGELEDKSPIINCDNP